MSAAVGPWRAVSYGSPMIVRECGPEHPSWNEEAIQCHSREQAEEFATALNSYKTLRSENARLREALSAYVGTDDKGGDCGSKSCGCGCCIQARSALAKDGAL